MQAPKLMMACLLGAVLISSVVSEERVCNIFESLNKAIAKAFNEIIQMKRQMPQMPPIPDMPNPMGFARVCYFTVT